MEMLWLIGATVVAVWSLFSTPSPATLADQPAGWPDQAGQASVSPAEPNRLEQAVERRAPGLVNEPVQLAAADPFAERCHTTGPALVAVDTATGERLWSQPIPSAVHAPVVLGRTVLISDPLLDRLLPSVGAIDVETGALRWQRHLEAVEVRPWGAANGTARYVAANPYRSDGGGLLLTIDATGSIVDEVTSELTEWSDLPESRHRAEGPIVKASLGGGYGAHLWLRRADGSLLQGDPVPFDDTYTTLGNNSSLGDAIQIGTEVTIVVLGSHRGPNSLAIAYSNTDGSRLWSREHVRSAAVATLDGRDVVVYDKRNTKEPDAPSTRSLYVVEGLDPDRTLWSAELTVNDQGGNGFLGSTGQNLLFAAGDELPADDPTGLRLVTVGDGREAPERLVAADGYGGGLSSRHILADDLLVVAADTSLLIRPDGDAIVADLGQQVQHVVRAGDTLLVVTGSPIAGCR
jgi:outer membrane protein assembly factor BamB